MYLPCAQVGVQSLTFSTPLPNPTACQLVHFSPATYSLDGMQPMSYTAGRTLPWPAQLTSTTGLEAADAGPAAATIPVTVPATAISPDASKTRARNSRIGYPLQRPLRHHPL